MFEISQGDILKVEHINFPVLVVSKNFFNSEEQAIVCPITEQASLAPLHIAVDIKNLKGFVLCEQVKFLDLRIRGYKKISELNREDIMNIADAVQGIFDYYPYG